MRRGIFSLLVAVLTLVTIFPGMASAEEDIVARVTAKFWWWTAGVATASGYATDGRCISGTAIGMPEMGDMGVHYTKMAHVDAAFNALEPEALLFDPMTNKLLGVEYIVVSATRPWAFGQQFNPHRPVPGAWALHLWLVENKNGQFADWNPAVKCSWDPARETVLIGEARLDEMRIKLELEPAKGISMLMDGRWVDIAMAEGKYHVEVKPEDPKSNTRISNAQVRFSATNKDTGGKVDLDLHPMWGSSGLHYSANSDLPDGTYVATVVVGVPTFMRAGSDRERWMSPIQAHFEFKLENGLLVSAKVIAGPEAPMKEMTPAAPTPAAAPGSRECQGCKGQDS